MVTDTHTNQVPPRVNKACVLMLLVNPPIAHMLQLKMDIYSVKSTLDTQIATLCYKLVIVTALDK